MKKKHFIAPVLALGIIGGFIAVPNAIFADSDAVTDSTPATTDSTAVSQSANTSTDVTVPTTGNDVIIPQAAGLNAIDTDVGGSATAQAAFNVPKGYGHTKLRMKNFSDHRVKVTLTHVESAKEYFSEVSIAPHQTVIWNSYDEGWSDGLRSGTYTLMWRGGDYKVDGHVWGVVASTPSGLGD
ncbi:hypothetical protein G3M74_00645 [Paenibacillus polymyxa]|nr:hypothetical protein [Paenibacillus polymyxa]